MGHSVRRQPVSVAGVYMATLLASSCVWGLAARAAQAQTMVNGTTRHFSIAAQPLRSALHHYLQQSGIQVAYPTAEAGSVQSSAVSGDLTPQIALSRLLVGTGLTYSFTGPQSVVLTKASSSTITLGPVRVGGQERENAQSAYGPGVGFVATRSASATRTDTRMIETPKSIYVVTRKQMDDLQPQSIAEALRYTPGVVAAPGSAISSSPSSNTFQPVYQRGFESYTFVDGLLNGTSVTDPFFLDRVEALSGPSSVMYGQAAPGGIVNMALKRPTEYARHQVNVGFGSYGRYEGQIDMSGPLNAKRNLLYRVVAMGNTQGSQVDYNHYKRVAAQGDLEWKIDDKTSLTFIGQFMYSPETMTGAYVPAYGSVLKSSYGKIPINRYYGDPSFHQNWDREFLGEVLLHHEFTKNLQFNSTVRYDGQSDAHCNLNIRQYDFVNNIVSRLANCSHVNNSQSMQMTSNISYKLRTGPVTHNFLVGVDYRNQTSDGRSKFYLGNVPSISITNPQYHQYTISDYIMAINGKYTMYKYGYWQDAVYFQDQIKWKKVFVTLAGRQDWNGYGGDFTRPFTWNAGINYVFDFGLAPYFNYSTSFMPQVGEVYNNQTLRQADPLNGRQWEVGLKYEIPKIQSFFTAAYYDVKENNVLVSNPDFPDYNLEIGQVRSRGVELSLHANLAQGLDLIANYTFSRPINSKTNLTSTDINGNTVSLLGKKLTFQPKHAASVFLDYRFPTTLAPGLSINFGVRYQGSTWGDTANSFRNPGYVLFDSGLNYEIGQTVKALKGLSLRLSMTNSSNHTYVICGGLTSCQYGEQRRVFGMVGYRW
ncbi:TonB-dependent siderophore receptor [Acetobacter senegalensis]|uniref:TonB-dependent siderophore receptor n=1 Tax=Acetobacter senegalensis TaxID=446692 RepID=UPI002651B719|nr:TonB-dependent siderophore receptor [Acetobacter senegalensis]MDN7350021.1 TonB-dependent siderophore receptor [Acetobacter senegalensis]